MRSLSRLAFGSAAMAFWLCASAQNADQQADSSNQPDPPSRVARLSYLQGTVSLLPAGNGDTDWTQAAINRPLTSGDRLALDSAARAELQMGSAEVHLDRDANFTFLELSDNVLQASLTSGAAHINVRELAKGEVIEIDTPHAAVALKRPGEYHIALLEDGATTLVKTYVGESEITDSRGAQPLQAKEQALVRGEAPTTVARADPRNAFDAWANERNGRRERASASRYVAPEVIGSEDLDAYGDWDYDASYGRVWYPRHVAADWAPYQYGNWTWIAPWGWTWVDHAPWGFAPFHYGRWAYVRTRWCWVPGPIHVRPVYAPALVAWVGAAPGFSVSVSFGAGVGWFPLAPHEVYVPYYRYSHNHFYRVNRANTVFVNNVYINRAYTHRNSYMHHANRSVRNAVTVVNRDAFVGSRPVRDHIIRVNDRDWRVTNTPPAIPPKRDHHESRGNQGSQPTPRGHDRQVVARNTPRPHARFEPPTSPTSSSASSSSREARRRDTSREQWGGGSNVDARGRPATPSPSGRGHTSNPSEDSRSRTDNHNRADPRARMDQDHRSNGGSRFDAHSRSNTGNIGLPSDRSASLPQGQVVGERERRNELRNRDEFADRGPREPVSPQQALRTEPRRAPQEPARERAEMPRFDARERAEARPMPSFERQDRSQRPAYDIPQREARPREPSRQPSFERPERSSQAQSAPRDQQRESRSREHSGRQERR